MIKKMTREEISVLNKKIKLASRYSLGFHQGTQEYEQETVLFDAIPINAESDMQIIIAEQNGELHVKVDYGHFGNPLQPLTNELSACHLTRINEGYEPFSFEVHDEIDDYEKERDKAMQEVSDILMNHYGLK